MKVVATIIIELAENCEGRKADIDMIQRYISCRFCKGLVKEDNFRGRILLNIRKTRSSVIDIT